MLLWLTSSGSGEWLALGRDLKQALTCRHPRGAPVDAQDQLVQIALEILRLHAVVASRSPQRL